MDYKQRLADAKTMYARPVKANLPNQKFKRGQRVKVADEMPEYMSHFPKGFEAIVEYTYGQKYDGEDYDNYSLIVLEKGKPINSIAWYYESQLTLLNKDCKVGLKIIKDYDDAILRTR